MRFLRKESRALSCLALTWALLVTGWVPSVPAQTPTYTISGIVRTSGDAGLSGVTMTLSNGTTTIATQTTESGGVYFFANVAAGGNYTVTPSRASFIFNPASQTFSNLSSNQTAPDYVAASVAASGYSISGRVTDSGGASLASVGMFLNVPGASGPPTATATTDASGNYSFAGVAAGGSYEVRASRAGFSFSPRSQNLTNLGANQTGINFTANPAYTINGRITDGSGVGIARIGLTLTGAGSDRRGAQTDASGNFSITGVPAGGTYTLTPLAISHNFDPASRTFASLSGDQTTGFTANSTYTSTPRSNGKIAFALRGAGGPPNVFTINADGTSQTQLTTLTSSAPAWSPDGTKIAFNSGSKIWTMNADGNRQTRITSDSSVDSEHGWSPDGAKLLFVKSDAGSNAIYLTNADGSSQTQYAQGASLSDAALSPDGTKMLFSSLNSPDPTYNFSGDIFVVETLDGGNLTNLTNNSTTNIESNPAWSPDGRRIAFARDAKIWVMNADGSGSLQLTNNSARNDSHPTWSPDNTKIAFASVAGSVAGIYVMNADGTNQLSIATRPSASDVISDLAWQPLLTPTSAPTIVGAGVTVRPGGTGSGGAGSDAAITFTSVATAGITTIAPISSAAVGPLPAGFTLLNEASAFEVTTTAAITGHIEVSFRLLSVTDPSVFETLRVMHGERDLVTGLTVLVDRTSRRDFPTRTIYARVPSLSPFVIAQAATPPVALQFNRDNYSVGEGDGTLTLTVTRTGDASGAAAVNFVTSGNTAFVRCDLQSDGTALDRCDYTAALDIVGFAAGETTKTFTISITDDAHVEGPETLLVTLSNPSTGAGLGGPNTAVVTITDNDTTATAANPVDEARFFVQRQYLDFLGREPEAAGFDAWLGVLERCGTNPSCDRIAVSASFFRSEEFQVKGYFFYRFYTTAFGRRPSYAEFERDVRLFSARTDAEVEVKKAEFVNDFMNRAASTSGLLSNTAYVNQLLTNAGVTLAARDEMVSDLEGGRQTRAQVLRRIAESAEVYSKEYNPAFVAMQYFGYLRRDPEEAGYQDWLRVINANPADYRTMVQGFATSEEYRLRFGRP